MSPEKESGKSLNWNELTKEPYWKKELNSVGKAAKHHEKKVAKKAGNKK